MDYKVIYIYIIKLNIKFLALMDAESNSKLKTIKTVWLVRLCQSKLL